MEGLNKKYISGGYIAECAAVKELTEDMRRKYNQVCESYGITWDMLVPRLGLLCRVFASDDPKAELAKLVMELSGLFYLPDFETLDECENWCREWREKRGKILDQDLLAVQTFLANLRVSSENQMN